MAVTIGLNGFGRIGRYLLRLLAADKDLHVKVINARAKNNELAHLFKYDSVHGTYQGQISHNDEGLLVEGRQVQITRNPANDWKWSELGVDIVVETTGTIKDGAGLAKHLDCGAKKVILSAPGTDVDTTIVMGVNNKDYDPKKHRIISNASCTTNCLAPVTKIINDNLGIKHGLMTTIHSYTMNQRLLDGSHKDLRRGRAAGLSMIPTSTGAAKALGLVIPELKGKLDGMAIRVPTPNVSLVDLTCEVNRDTSVEEVNAILKNAANTIMQGHMGYSEEALVSCDYNGSIYGGVVDSLCTNVSDKRMVKLIIWYDNEAGFTNQLVRLLRMVGASL